jgi:hypothetical protein
MQVVRICTVVTDHAQGPGPYVTPNIRCSGDYPCVATPGYNAPTGLGTPDGIGAFWRQPCAPRPAARRPEMSARPAGRR